MPKTDQQAFLDAYMRNYAKAQAQTVSGGAGQMTSARQVGQAAMNAAKTDLPDYSGAVGGFASAYAKQVEANRKAAEKAAKQAAKEAEKAAKEAAEKQEQETEEKQLAGLDAYRASKAKLGGQDSGEQTPGVLKRLGAGVGAGVTGLAAGTANLADTARRTVQQRTQSMDNEAFALAVSTRDEMDAELARLLDSGLAFEADGVTPTEAYRAALLTRDAAEELMQASEADAPERAQAVQGLLDVSGGLSDTALTGLEGLPRLLGETGISIAQNLPALGLGLINPALGLGAMAASAAGSRAAELEGEGKGLGEALGRGLVSGGIEMLTEKLPMDALLDMVKTGGKGAVRQILQQAATEGGEESVSYLLNLLADAAAGDEAEFSLEELARSAAGGALSGGIMGSAGTLVGRALHPEPGANAPKTAQNRKAGSLPTLVETAPDGGNAAAVQGAVPTAEQQAAELAEVQQGEQSQGVAQTVPGLVQAVPGSEAAQGMAETVPGSEADQAAEPVQTLGQWLFGDEDAATGEPDAERDGAVYTLSKQAQAITGRGANAQDTIRVRKFLERLPEMSWEEAQAEAEKIAEEIVHEEDFYEVDPGQYENAPVPIQRALFDKQPIVVSEDDMEALRARFGEKDKRARRLTPQQMGRKLGLKLVKSAPGVNGDDPSALWMTYDGVPIDLPDGVGSDYMGQFADLLVKWREDGGGGLVDTPSYEYAKRKAYADLLGLPEPGFEEYSGTQYDEAEQAGVPDEMTAEEIAAYSAEFAPQGEDLVMLEDWRAAAEDSLRARLNGTLPNLAEMMDEPVLDVAKRQKNAAAVQGAEGQPLVLRRGGQSGVLSPVQSAPDGLPESIGAMRSDPTSYSAMQNAYGTHEPGELAARVVDVPVSTDGTDRVSKAAQTIMEAAQTPDEMVELLEEQVRSGTFSHTVMSDRDAVRSAAAYIDGHGFDASAYEFLERVEKDQPLDKNDIVRGQMLYTLAAQKGDTETAMNLAVYLARVATESGQNLQAQRLLKRLTPAGRLAYVTRVKENLERECREKYGMDGIDIPQHLADALLQAGPDDARAQRQAMQDIYQAIADQLPASWSESLNAWRYMVMLTNPATHIRNVLGNIIMYPQRRLKNLLGTAMEQAIPQEQRTKAILTPADRALKEFARQDVDNVLDELESGQRYRDERNLIYRLRNPFVHAKNGQAHPTLASRALGGLNRMNSDLMGAEDMVFKRSTYADTLAQVLKARGLDPETMSTEELNEVRAIAIEEAQRATFTEANQIADLIGRIERTNAVTRVLVGGILPFKATPMNIVRRSVAYSPAGLVGALGRGAWDARHGSFNAARFVDDLAQGLSGTSIFMLGAFLAAQGILNCAGSDKKKEQGLEDAQGYQDYSVNLGGGSYTIDWWGPTAVAMFAGAALYEANQDKGADAWNNLATALMNSTEPLFDMTMLEGVNSAIQTASYGGSAPVTAIASTMATNFATQLIPTLSGQVARAVDGTRRTVYTDKTGFAGEVDKTVQKVKNKIPGLSQDNQPYVDIWGRTQDIVGGNTAGRLAYGMLSPGYYAPQTVTDADRLVESVYELTGDSSVIPGLMSSSVSVEGESVKLTPEQYTAAKQTKGQTAYSIMDGLADDPSFDSLSAEQQGKVLSAANSLASELAKMEVIPSLMEAHERAVAGGTLTKTGRLAQLYMTGGADAVIPYLEMNVLKNAVSSDYKDGKAVSGSKKKNFIAAAMQAGYTYEQAEYAYDKVL